MKKKRTETEANIQHPADSCENPIGISRFVATAWKSEKHGARDTAYGLKLSVANRDSFFNRDQKQITLELEGGPTIAINIDKASFWNETCRELIHKLIGVWFAKNGVTPWPIGKPPRIELMATAANSYLMKRPGLYAGFEYLNRIMRRTEELTAQGLAKEEARYTARLEDRLSSWPAEWGNELHIIIYGDFESPECDLAFSDLGIIVRAGAVESIFITSAHCVLECRVMVADKTVDEVRNAMSRVNKLLSILTALDWGNSGAGWWCQITHGAVAGSVGSIDRGEVIRAINSLDRLRPEVRRKVESALYWIREPRKMMKERHRDDVLRVYAGYWNAFECLVDAICMKHEAPVENITVKNARIEKLLLDDFNGKATTEFIEKCYRSIVDPGLKSRASHALRVCFPELAGKYISECFRVSPKRDRLYDIRNAINHGVIDADNVGELIRVEEKRRRLWFIVFGMLGRLISIPIPRDSPYDEL